MSEKKGTRPDVGASERAKEPGSNHHESPDSTIDFTITPPPRQGVHIADFLSHGATSGQTVTDLERLTGWKNREIRKQIERERRSGTLILSDNAHGYYLTDDPAEAQRFARSMRHRAREIILTAQAIEEATAVD